MPSGRVWSSVAAALGLAGVTGGVWALTLRRSYWCTPEESHGRPWQRKPAARVIGGVAVAADGGLGYGYVRTGAR